MAIAIERAVNDAVTGEDVVEPCPACGSTLEVTVIRPDVLIRCPNGHVDAHRSLRSDPGGAMRWGFLIAAMLIIGLGLVRRFYFDGRPDPHRTQYIDNAFAQPTAK
jgi:hypothetical protein